MTDWAQIFTGLLFHAYVEIHQERKLVLDNYQKCPGSLNRQFAEPLISWIEYAIILFILLWIYLFDFYTLYAIK